MFRIRGEVKDYAWGVVDGLHSWTGQRTGRQQAELWFGIHPRGSSTVIDDGSDLADHLTREQAPVLAKILAAAQPLSVQVHPNAHDAARMWESQQIAGPAILADPYEKAEVLVALEPFDAFVGWRPPQDAAEIIERIDGLALAASALHAKDRITAIQMIVERKEQAADFARAVPEAVVAAQESGALSRALTDAELKAYRMAATDFPDDIGVALTPLLDFRTLQRGEAVYLAPGIPHSYVRGVGFEVMTSSDNVLRLGLTSKPVFIDHALPILDFTSAPQFLSGGGRIAPEGAKFCVDIVEGDSLALPPGDFRLVVAIDGDCQVQSAEESLSLEQGMAVAIAPEEPEAVVTVRRVAVAVTAPRLEG